MDWVEIIGGSERLGRDNRRVSKEDNIACYIQCRRVSGVEVLRSKATE
jgi:hypothetical protein